jgi:hypothetical protein
MKQLSPVEMIYMYLLNDYKKAHQGKLDEVREVGVVIRYFEKRWPADVARYKARFEDKNDPD